MKKFIVILLLLFIASPAYAWRNVGFKQQIDANLIILDTSDFDNNLDSADSNVQAMAETLDELAAGGGGAPADAKYITQTADGTLSAEQALSSLSTGIMKVTTTTGVISSITDNSSNWNTAYGWGDHSSQNYLDLDTYPNADTDSTDDFDGNYSSLSGAPADLSDFNDDIGVSSDWDEFSDLPTAAVTNGDTTHVSTADAIYDFCETTQAYYNSGDSPTFAALTISDSGKATADEVALKPAVTVTVAASDSRGKDTADYICDGTGDQSEINTAIGVVQALGGGCVQLLDGNYSLSDSITISDDGVTLQGQGAATVIYPQNSTGVAATFDIIECDVDSTKYGVVIRYLKINGNHDGGEGNTGRGFYNGAGDANIEDVHFYDVQIIETGGVAIELASAWGAVIDKVIIEFCETHAVVFNNGDGGLIFGCKFIDNAGNQVQLDSGADKTRIMANYFHSEDTFDAISIASDYNIVIGNDIEGSGEGSSQGITVTGDANIATANVITAGTEITDAIYLGAGTSRNQYNGNFINLTSGDRIDDDGDTNRAKFVEDDDFAFASWNYPNAGLKFNITAGGRYDFTDTDGNADAYINVSGKAFLSAGLTIGTDQDANHIDDATHGSGSTTMYIGNETIDTSAVSDMRMKENITPTQYGLDTINKLNVVDFNYIYNPDEVVTGMIAQEVMKIYPQAVKLRNDGYYMIEYKELIPVLIKAIQELKNERAS